MNLILACRLNFSKLTIPNGTLCKIMNSFSPPKKYKLVPHARPLRSNFLQPRPQPNVIGMVQLGGGGPNQQFRNQPHRPNPFTYNPDNGNHEIVEHHFEENYTPETDFKQIPRLPPIDEDKFGGKLYDFWSFC